MGIIYKSEKDIFIKHYIKFTVEQNGKRIVFK